jgi:hypothetical protein
MPKIPQSQIESEVVAAVRAAGGRIAHDELVTKIANYYGGMYNSMTERKILIPELVKNEQGKLKIFYTLGTGG